MDGADPKWAQYWIECALGDFDAAVAEAERVAPPGDIGGAPRDSYIRNMVRNHIEQYQREGLE